MCYSIVVINHRKKNSPLFIITIVALVIIAVFFLVKGKLFQDRYQKDSNHLTYSDEKFTFFYPMGAKVYKFDNGTIRVVLSDQDIHIDLERRYYNPDSFSAKQLAGDYYKLRTINLHNSSPKKSNNPNINAYVLTRYLQNIEFNILSDQAFIDSSEDVYILKMSLIGESMSKYNEGHKAFNLILNSLNIK